MSGPGGDRGDGRGPRPSRGAELGAGTPLDAHLLALLRDLFEAQKALAEGALAQLDDAQLHRSLGAGDDNSAAVLVQHMAGNLRSRFRDFLATDGEKPDRDRDAEFEDAELGRAELMARWEEGWRTLFTTLEALTPGDLPRTVTIRGEPHTALQALLRQLAHHAQHAGQLVMLAKHLRGASWRTLSIPKRPPGGGAPPGGEAES